MAPPSQPSLLLQPLHSSFLRSVLFPFCFVLFFPIFYFVFHSFFTHTLFTFPSPSPSGGGLINVHLIIFYVGWLSQSHLFCWCCCCCSCWGVFVCVCVLKIFQCSNFLLCLPVLLIGHINSETRYCGAKQTIFYDPPVPLKS